MIEIVRSPIHQVNAVELRETLIGWGREHFRPYPWRLANDPFQILIAEVMLHRTQASQVEPVYRSLIQLYPDCAALASAPTERLDELLQPLGLHWRTRLFHMMVSQLMEQHEGQVPSNKADLTSLSGVSDYIASAVRCFAWNQPEALVDTNSVRVVGRLLGLSTRDSSRRNRFIRALIGALLERERPRAYNYSLLDLADRVCSRRRAPDCAVCPIAVFCYHAIDPKCSSTVR